MRGEFELIARHFAPLAAPGAEGLRNDAAVYRPAPGRELVLTLDTMVAGVHFLAQDPAAAVGRKLLRVNLSDLAAMGARPRGYLLSTALTEETEEAWVAEFAAGLAEDQRHFGVQLYGGDTVSTPGPLTLSLTAFGEVAAGCALRRSGAGAGDAVYVSGTIGDGVLGLRVLEGGLDGLAAAEREALARRYRLPEPRLALGAALAEQGLASAAIDVSDGLAADLGHIAEESGLGADVEAAAVPLSAAAAAALAADPGLLPELLGGGDDYELVIAVPPAGEAALAQLARELAVPVARIGRMTAGEGLRVVDAQGRKVDLPAPGWRHF